jgi:hypothetical protein
MSPQLQPKVTFTIQFNPPQLQTPKYTEWIQGLDFTMHPTKQPVNEHRTHRPTAMLKLAIKNLSYHIMNIYTSNWIGFFITETFNAPDRMCMLSQKTNMIPAQKNSSWCPLTLGHCSGSSDTTVLAGRTAGAKAQITEKEAPQCPSANGHYQNPQFATESHHRRAAAIVRNPSIAMECRVPPTSTAVPPPRESQIRVAPARASARAERSYCSTALQRWRRGGRGSERLTWRRSIRRRRRPGTPRRTWPGRTPWPTLPASGGSASRRPDPCLRQRRHNLPRTLASGRRSSRGPRGNPCSVKRRRRRAISGWGLGRRDEMPLTTLYPQDFSQVRARGAAL